jgi:hypothetical protein
VSANADQPVALVFDRRRRSRGAAEDHPTRGQVVERLRAMQFRVQHLDAQVERFGNVPLRARADASHRPVVVTRAVARSPSGRLTQDNRQRQRH